MLSEPEVAPLHGGFKEGWVWVPDEKEGYLAGWVAKEGINNERVVEGEIIMAAGAKVKTMPFHALSQMNSTELDRVENIGELEFLNEASVAHSLKLRYASGEMYTYSGLCLISINPYIDLPLYTDDIIQEYRGKRCDQNPPHIFAVAELAWVNLVETGESQSIVLTGESGAGKTENTMQAVQYLVSITTRPVNTAVPATGGFEPSNVQHQGTFLTGKENSTINTTSILPLKLKEQLLQANIILEAFGNARTARNENSSRFSKLVRVAFTKNGSFVGVYVDWYMLEKSRVVARSEIEQNFHVFYMLLEGEGWRDTLLLQAGTQEYEYLKKPQEIDGVDHRQKWHLLKNALDIVGFTFDEQLDLFRVMAAILHIGNIDIFSDRAAQAQIKSNVALENTCKLLGISPQSFSQSILRPRVFTSQVWITLTRTRQQAIEDLNALCKTIYEKVFGFLMERINRALDGPKFNSSFIGVLDITGFEMDRINGFEQLCINYTNERIQQFFNHHTFVVEREEYMRESVEWPFVDFGIDLQPTIELIGATGNNGHTGILTCLDEEFVRLGATDTTFTSKLHAMWALTAPKEEKLVHISQSKYTPAQFSKGFIIQHYAGRVEYQTDGWLVKNKDLPNDDIIRVMVKSNNQFVSDLFLGLVGVGGLEVQNTVAFGNMKEQFVKRPFTAVCKRVCRTRFLAPKI
ncbi:unnamed protein product [Rhizoctonia solani]|uniref:Myosin motor domain-containing protein n=1 Tax=Rhizoctonia solani TaxID=456999 RepID=A0A8H2XNU3_9AGAM|nr:unnamed protein product [Rhizoctonia solani]